MLIESQSAIEMLELIPFEMAIKYSSGAHNGDEHDEKWNSNEVSNWHWNGCPLNGAEKKRHIPL